MPDTYRVKIILLIKVIELKSFPTSLFSLFFIYMNNLSDNIRLNLWTDPSKVKFW